MAYKNGLIPASKLRAITPHGKLPATAAKSWERLRKRLALEGVRLVPSSAGDAYRELQRQETLFYQNYDNTWRRGLTVGNGGIKHYRGKTWYRKPGKATAATPGTSNHGWGKAVDIAGLGGFTGKNYLLLKRIAGEFGWNNTEGSRINEPWHWGYNIATDSQRARVGWHHIARRTAGSTGLRFYKQRKTGIAKNVTRTKKLGTNIKIVLVVGAWGLTKKGDWVKLAKLKKGKK